MDIWGWLLEVYCIPFGKGSLFTAGWEHTGSNSNPGSSHAGEPIAGPSTCCPLWSNKGNYMKLKSFFCTAKETIIKMKRQPTEQKNIFASHISDKGLIKYIKYSYNSITKNNPL